MLGIFETSDIQVQVVFVSAGGLCVASKFRGRPASPAGPAWTARSRGPDGPEPRGNSGLES